MVPRIFRGSDDADTVGLERIDEAPTNAGPGPLHRVIGLQDAHDPTAVLFYCAGLICGASIEVQGRERPFTDPAQPTREDGAEDTRQLSLQEDDGARLAHLKPRAGPGFDPFSQR